MSHLYISIYVANLRILIVLLIKSTCVIFFFEPFSLTLFRFTLALIIFNEHLTRVNLFSYYVKTCKDSISNRIY